METRQSRMDKYFEDSNNINKESNNEENRHTSSRLQRNQELYKKVSSLEIEGFDLNSNSTILDVNASSIDIDDVKEQLQVRYRETPRNKSFGDTDELNLPKINLDETREYDINAILAKAKEEKEINYEEDRHKKVNDVLKDIEEYTKNIKEKSDTGVNSKKEEELKELIDTINAKELIEKEKNLTLTGEMDPLDLLSDLKGDDDNTKVLGQYSDFTDTITDDTIKTEELTTEEINNIISKEDSDTEEITKVVPPVKEETQELDKTEETDKFEDTAELFTTTEIDSTEKVELNREEKKKDKKDKKDKKKDKNLENLDNSFIGNTSTFNKEDFDDFDDLKEDMKVSKIIIRILIIVIIIIFIAGLVILANGKLNWGLF